MLRVAVAAFQDNFSQTCQKIVDEKTHGWWFKFSTDHCA